MFFMGTKPACKAGLSFYPEGRCPRQLGREMPDTISHLCPVTHGHPGPSEGRVHALGHLAFAATPPQSLAWPVYFFGGHGPCLNSTSPALWLDGHRTPTQPRPSQVGKLRCSSQAPRRSPLPASSNRFPRSPRAA